MKSRFLLVVLLGLSLACSKSDSTITPVDPITSLDCASATTTSAPTVGIPFSNILSVPYSGGNGTAYSSGTAIASIGISGLTATLQAGTLANGTGNFSFALSGTPAESGTASFPFAFGSLSCTINLDVDDVPLVQYGTPFAGVPEPEDAVIYQVNLRAFSATRDLQGVINRLDAIDNLGVNVIYLMPTYPVGVLKSINSPYCVKDYKAVNDEFGTLTDLRNLIDGAHSRGMAVILDWVANHTAWDHPWITNHKSWYQQDGSGNIQSPPLGWLDVAQLNYTNSAMRLEMIKSMKYWVYTANCDGFRCDYADGPPNDFWMQAIDTLRNVSTHKLLMLAETNGTSKYNAGFDYIFGFGFYSNLKSIFGNNASVLTIDNLNTSDYAGANSHQQVVRYLTNHDVNSSDGVPLDLFGGSAGTMASFVVVAYMKSVPMIYNGQEVGTTYPLSYLTLGPTITWNQNPTMEAEYKKIIDFRNSSVAIRRGTLVSYSNADVCAFTKTAGVEQVLVISNLRNASLSYTLPGAIAGTSWNDAFTGTPITLGTQVSLTPYSYIVLTH